MVQGQSQTQGAARAALPTAEKLARKGETTREGLRLRFLFLNLVVDVWHGIGVYIGMALVLLFVCYVVLVYDRHRSQMVVLDMDSVLDLRLIQRFHSLTWGR